MMSDWLEELLMKYRDDSWEETAEAIRQDIASRLPVKIKRIRFDCERPDEDSSEYGYNHALTDVRQALGIKEA